MTEKLKLRVIPSQKRLRAEAIFAHLEQRERAEALDELRSMVKTPCFECGLFPDIDRPHDLLDVLS